MRGYVIGEDDGLLYIECCICGNRSYHPADVHQKYCNYCHKWHEE